MIRAVLLLCVGCNAILGIRNTGAVDAQQFDAPADAPFACPPLGGVPHFSQTLHQVLSQDCFSYAVSGDRATASCFADGQFGIFEGAVGEVMRPAPGVIAFTSDEQLDEPHLSPDHQRLLARAYNFSTGAQGVRFYQWAGDTWQLGPAPPFGTGINDGIGALARGPTGDRICVRNAPAEAIDEWAYEAGQWRLVHHMTSAELGFSTVYDVEMTSDGLHAIIYTDTTMAAYVDRADEDAPFTAGRLLPELPHRQPGNSLTDDCGRVYLTGLQNVFYAQHL